MLTAIRVLGYRLVCVLGCVRLYVYPLLGVCERGKVMPEWFPGRQLSAVCQPVTRPPVPALLDRVTGVTHTLCFPSMDVYANASVARCFIYVFIWKSSLAKCSVWLLKPKHILYQPTHHHNAKCLFYLSGKHSHSQDVTPCNMLFINWHHDMLFKTSSV